MVQRPLFAVVLSASATFGPYRGASCSAWQSRSFLSAVFLHRHNSNLVRLSASRNAGAVRYADPVVESPTRGEAVGGRLVRGVPELSNCDLNMRSAPYAEHGEVVSWLFRPEMRRGDSGVVFRPDEISVFCPCSFPMPVADATLWRGSPILRPPRRITNRSTPGFRSLASAVSVCVVARAFGGGCRSAACSCRRRSQHIRSLRPRGGARVLVSARWLTGLLPAYFCRK